jgi:hypothetical protein
MITFDFKTGQEKVHEQSSNDHPRVLDTEHFP